MTHAKGATTMLHARGPLALGVLPSGMGARLIRATEQKGRAGRGLSWPMWAIPEQFPGEGCAQPDRDLPVLRPGGPGG